MGTQYGSFGFNDNLSFCVDAGSPKSFSNVGPIIQDVLNTSNTGIFVNSAKWSTFNNGSIYFNGTSDFSLFPTSNNFDFGTGDFTIELFVSFKSVSDSVIILQNDGISASTNTKWWLGYTANTLRFGRHSTSDAAYASLTPVVDTWYHMAVTRISGTISMYVNGIALSVTNPTVFSGVNFTQAGLSLGAGSQGSQTFPLSSPEKAQAFGLPAGSYYFKSGVMSSALLMEFQPNYIDNLPFVCVFRSPYNSTATTNLLGNSIPMKGFLVQRDTLDYRGAVYWNTATTYIQTSGITADSGYAYRKVMLGYGGGHGIYNTNQNVCSWGASTGAIGAGYNGATCGSFPNGLLWGTGTAGAAYANMSGTWSHWVYWTG